MSIPVKQIDEYRWEIPIGAVPDMRVPGRIFSNLKMMHRIRNDGSLKQVAQAATLPGAVKASMAMPDIHYGYGFPIGGVLATRFDTGVISPGGVGFDINCGVRLLTTPLTEKDVRDRLDMLMARLFSSIPSGVGSKGKLHLGQSELQKVIRTGSRWAVESGYGLPEDLEFTEASGWLRGADPSDISSHACQRGENQMGTLGSGNHFIEVQMVDQIFDPVKARLFGLEKGMVTVMIHSGSRGFGHQVCTDYLKVMDEAVRKYQIYIPDRQLACAPISSPEGKRYLSALRGAANYAWANRQCLSHWVREGFQSVFASDLSFGQMRLLYDVAHNIVKFETHSLEGKPVRLAVHRKGATRAFGPGEQDLPQRFRTTGQPVLVPGDMGSASYVLCGTKTAMNETFGSTCHGAGRVLSRKAAKRAAKGRSISRELAARGILAYATGRSTLVEEMPEAYKNVDDVVAVVHGAGIADMVARLRPMGVIKG